MRRIQVGLYFSFYLLAVQLAVHLAINLQTLKQFPGTNFILLVRRKQNGNLSKQESSNGGRQDRRQSLAVVSISHSGIMACCFSS